jgi:hypothetical protein
VGRSGLRTVVRREWDPFGLADSSAPEDEYDAYLGPIASMLRRGATVDELAAHLAAARADANVGDAARDRPAARAMIEWYGAAMRAAAGKNRH